MIDHPFRRQAGQLDPQGSGFLIAGVDRRPEPLLRQAERLGGEFPGPGDAVFLEVVAEAEVAQHLEKGQVAGRVADVFQIVVLAPGPHALLRRGGPLETQILPAQQGILELIHAGVGEQQRGVALRHERAGRRHPVPSRLEERQICAANFGRFHEQFAQPEKRPSIEACRTPRTGGQEKNPCLFPNSPFSECFWKALEQKKSIYINRLNHFNLAE